MKTFSVRKMGTRMGQPHYGAECALCRRVLAVAHLSKDAATRLATNHVRDQHNEGARLIKSATK